MARHSSYLPVGCVTRTTITPTPLNPNIQLGPLPLTESEARRSSDEELGKVLHK